MTHFHAKSVEPRTNSSRPQHEQNKQSKNACKPALSLQATDPDSSTSEIHDLPVRVPSLTNSPRCAPANPTRPTRPSAPRRVRPVRVDAWAVPVSVNWSRTRTTTLKVKRGMPSAEWALPF